MAGGLLNDQLHYAETQIIADPAGNGDCEEEGDSTSNEDDPNESTYRETYHEFFLRHLQNMIHFLVEDWFISAMLGFITAILSISVDLSYEYLNHYKVIVYDQAMKVDRIVGFSAWVMYIVAFVGGGAIVCKYISKHAIGSGIPEVKVIMNGFMLQNYLTFRTLVAKVAGLVLTLGSGLPVGKEGPFVHMGAIVATLLAKATRPFQHNAFYSNEGRDVEILSSGCAVGIACTFSAPAGAVLYGIESTHKYFAVKSYWRSFFATTCSALLFRFANYAIIPKDIAGSITAYYQTSFPNEVFVVEEIPIFALIGIMSGLFGAAFLILHKRISKFIRRNRIFLKVFGKDGFAFTIFMAFVVGVITFPAGVGSYVHGRYNFRETLSDLISNCTMTLYNTSISRGCDREMVFSWTADAAATTPNVMPTLVGYFLVMFVLVPICITLAVPAGIFVPAFVLGACGGRIVGELMVIFFPDGMRGPLGPQIYPGLYAVVGAAAFTGAVTHSLSIAVIVCETTGQLSPLLPVLIALMIGNAVSSFLHPSIYESIIMLKKYPHLTELPPSRISVHTLKVEQIMVKDIVYITKDTTYKDLRELLISTPQLRSYPLVTDDEERILLGSVARKYLNFLVTIHLGQDPGLTMRRRSQAADMFGTYNRTSVMRTSMSGHTLLSNSPLHENLKKNGLRTSLSFHRKSDPSLAESVLLDRAMKLEKPIDIDDLAVDSAPFQLVLGTSLFKVHTLFSLLGLNHAYVTHRGRLVGVVALRELRLALSDIYVRGAVPNKESSCGSVQRLNDFHIEKPEIIKGNKSYYNGTLSVPKDNDGFSGISINIHPPIEEEEDNGEEINHEETLLLNDVTHIDEETDEDEKNGEK